jgi:exopolysaccharide biosynthesis protein
MFLVIDGRDITWSVGCTVGDMAEIMMQYGVVNAACCDGGSSSIMAYNGEVLNHNSSANPAYGRRMPNAFLVRPK